MVAIEATDPLPLFRFLVSCACHAAPWRRSPVLIAVSNGACSDAYDQIEKKALEVNEKVIPKESVAEAKPESKSVSTDEMEIREGLGYVRGSDVPYTGKVSKLYESGQKELELNVKDGKYDGLVVWWHQNGQKKSEENWKDGKMTYEKFWNSKGEKVDSKEEAE